MLTLVTVKGYPLLHLRLPHSLAVFALLIGLGIVGLAGITLYGLVDSPGGRSYNGDRLAFSASSQTREEELQHLIDRDNTRLNDLQKENQDRETEVAQLEVRLMDLGKSLTSLKTNLPDNPAPTQKASGNRPNGTAVAQVGGASATSKYTNELQKLEAQLASLNQTVAEKKASLDTLQQSFYDYNAELVRLTGKEPPLPGPITNLRDAQALNPPNSLPGDGLLTSPFGWRVNPFQYGTRAWHDGIDIACTMGTPIYATKAGTVTFAAMDQNGYGLRVDVSHENGWLTFYGHQSRILVKVGQYINKGDTVGLCGSTGASTGPHIHYGLHFHGVMTNPLRYITVPVKWE